MARAYLRMAKIAYEQEDYAGAKLKIDSIKIKSPKAYHEIDAGFKLMQAIRMAENRRNVYYCDSLIAIKIAEIDALKTRFDYVRDARYEEFGKYVSKLYPLSVSEKQSTLRAAVTEKGDLYLESVLIGKAITHTRVKVSRSDGSFSETHDVTSDGLNYRFRTLDSYYEIVRYIAQDENSVAQFIYTYQQEPLTLTFVGKNTFYIPLSENAKNSVAKSFELSRLQHDIKVLEFEKGKSEALIRYLKDRKK